MTLFIVSGASGSGKTSLCRELSSQGFWVECVSHTTRDKRDGEIEGVDYYYIDKDKFIEMSSNDEFVEIVEYDGNMYGMSRYEIESKKNDSDLYIVAEYGGFKQLEEAYPESVSIFIHTDEEECKNRMISRGDSEEAIAKRLERYDKDIEYSAEYHWQLYNHNKIEDAIFALKYIIEHHRVSKTEDERCSDEE